MRIKIIPAALAIIVIALTAASTSAQMEQRYRADIPFDFSMGNSDMKAGNYAVGFFNPSSAITVLGISNRTTGETKLIKPITRGGDDRTYQAVLRFIKNGDHYDLAEIKGVDFDTKLKSTWSNVRQVTRGVGADTETVSIYLY